jgi:hypothetical protein
MVPSTAAVNAEPTTKPTPFKLVDASEGDTKAGCIQV